MWFEVEYNKIRQRLEEATILLNKLMNSNIDKKLEEEIKYFIFEYDKQWR